MSTAPDDVKRTLLEVLPKIARSSTLGLKSPKLRRTVSIAAARVANADLEPVTLPVYTATVPELKRYGFPRIRQTGWTSLMPSGDDTDDTVAAVDIDASGAAFAGVSSGPDLDDFARQVKQLPDDLRKQGVAQLRIPSIYLLAIWLGGRAGLDGGGAVLPVGKTPVPFEPGKVYGAKEFIELLSG